MKSPKAFGFCLLLCFASCSRTKRIVICDGEKSQCVTIIENADMRYIIDGEHDTINGTEYIQLDVSGIPELSDGFWICWLDNNQWEAVAEGETIMSTLDSTRHVLWKKLPVDDRGVPTEEKFRGPNCVVFSFYMMRDTPKSEAIIEIFD